MGRTLRGRRPLSVSSLLDVRSYFGRGFREPRSGMRLGSRWNPAPESRRLNRASASGRVAATPGRAPGTGATGQNRLHFNFRVLPPPGQEGPCLGGPGCEMNLVDTISMMPMGGAAGGAGRIGLLGARQSVG